MSYQINSHKYLNKIEFNYLVNFIKDDWSRNALLIKLAIATGARAQELLNLTHHDLIEGRILIRGLKNSNDREIPIDKQLYDALLALPRNETLFGIGYSMLNLIWKQYTPNPQKSFKCLRHSAAIYTFKKHKDVMLVKLMLGHKSLTNTNVYIEHIYCNENLKILLKK